MTPRARVKTPPHSREAEMGVLSSIFQSGGKALPECVEKINEEYFYVPAHRTIYVELRDVWDSGEPIDLITFTQRLRDRKILDSVGGAAYVTELQTFVPSEVNVQHYLEIVRDKYIRREIIAASTEAVRRAYEEQDGDPLILLDEHESKLTSVRSAHDRNGAFTMRTPDEILALPRDQSANYMGDRVLAKGQSLLVAGIGDLGKS